MGFNDNSRTAKCTIAFILRVGAMSNMARRKVVVGCSAAAG
jgi:hypothetical protein